MQLDNTSLIYSVIATKHAMCDHSPGITMNRGPQFALNKASIFSACSRLLC